ncbi:hypothetical protein ABPG72_015207 [Tetrahymena utriculariae]
MRAFKGLKRFGYNFISQNKCITRIAQYKIQSPQCLQRNIHFTFSIFQKSQSDYFKQIDIDNIQSSILLGQFNQRIKQIDDVEEALLFCRNILTEFELRMEVRSALHICILAIDLTKKLSSGQGISAYLYFQAKHALLINDLGLVDQARKESQELLVFYQVSREQLSLSEKIEVNLQLAQIFSYIKQYEQCEYLLEQSLSLIQSSSTFEVSKNQLFRIYSLLYSISFMKKDYKKAKEYGLLLYEILENSKENELSDLVQNLLLGIYFCFQKLGQENEAQQVLELLKKFEEIPKKNPLNLKEKQFKQTLNYLNKDKKLARDIHLKDKENAFFYNEIIQLYEHFVLKNQCDQGIQHFKKLQSELNQEKDLLRYLFLQDTIASLLSCQQNFKQAIEQCLNTHEILLKLRNQALYDDRLTFQNITILKQLHYQAKEFQKAIEWGEKWHCYCLNYNLFDHYDKGMAFSLQIQMASLNILQQTQQCLEYSNFSQDYLETFQDKLGLLEVYLIKTSLYIKLNQPQEVERYTRLAAKIYHINKTTVKPQVEQLFYNANLYLVFIFFKNDDEKSYLEFGKDYIELAKKYEKHDQKQTLFLKSIIYYELGVKSFEEKNFKESQSQLSQCLDLSKSDKELNVIYQKALICYTSTCIKQDMIREAEDSLSTLQKLFEQLPQGIEKNFIEIQLLAFQSNLHYKKNEINKFIETVEKQLEKQTSNKKQLQSQQKVILKDLLQANNYTTQVQNLIQKHNINLND